MAKKPTIKDIASIAGVSPASVSMILNGKSLSRFSEETVQAVYQVTRDLDYKQKQKKNKKDMVVVICPSLMNPYYATLIQSIEQEARSQGYLTLIFTTYWSRESEQEILRMVDNPQIAGVIFSMIPQQPELAEAVSKKVPMVAVGDRQCSLGIDTVDVNNYNAGRMVGRHLIDLGHMHVAYVSTALNNEHSSRVKRCTGLQDEYLHSCPRGTVTVYTQDVSAHTELYTTDIEHMVGYELAKQCLEETPDVTAIVAINDMVAYGVLDALTDAGKKIPDDLSVCGFDNIYPSSFNGVNLTTIEHAIVERGRSTFRLLAEKLTGQEGLAGESAITRVEYQSKLVVRGTTAPPPPADTAGTHCAADKRKKIPQGQSTPV